MIIDLTATLLGQQISIEIDADLHLATAGSDQRMEIHSIGAGNTLAERKRLEKPLLEHWLNQLKDTETERINSTKNLFGGMNAGMSE
jgi:hypothetical protein